MISQATDLQDTQDLTTPQASSDLVRSPDLADSRPASGTEAFVA
jgi:hypothetical protein